MHVKVRTVDGKTTATITVSKLTSVEDFRRLVEEKLEVKKEKQRFFYRGKQLEDGYTLFDYDIKLNDVVQLMVKADVEAVDSPAKAKTSTSNTEQINEEVSECLSKYFKVGDLVDVRNVSYGAWFEGKIVEIVRNIKEPGESEDNNLLYHVVFDEYENDPPVEVCLRNVRPRARHIYDFNDLKVGDMVMANYNIEDPKSRGYWYDVRITALKKTRTYKEIIGSIHADEDVVLLETCRITSCDDVFRIEKPVPVSARSEEVVVQRQNAPNCSRCNDNDKVKCKECSCHVCGGKDDPGSQILCDECNMAYHLRCLSPPLEAVPDSDEWYCPDCKNDDSEIVKAGEKLKDSKKKAKLPSKLNNSGRDWGKGMACVGRTKECTLVPPNHYGSIPGVEVGTCWLYRVQVSESGVHRPPVGGIHGRESDGAYSIVLSGGYEDDIDNGEEFLYTGSGGRDLSGNKRTADQSCDQTLTRLNKALALNCNVALNTSGAKAKDWKGGKPVRVVRSCKLRKHSEYAPQVGNRYDGLYKVVKYYPEKGKSGFVVWRYLLRRDDETPAPWTAAGQEHIQRHGLDKVEAPEGYDEATPESKKRKSTSDQSTEKKPKMVAHKLDAAVNKLIKQDLDNSKLWEACAAFLQEGKHKYISEVAEAFTCICCQEVTHRPVTTPCKHNMCKSCLKRSFAAEVYTCPSCRHELGEKYVLDVNETLGQVLCKLFPGYEVGR